MRRGAILLKNMNLLILQAVAINSADLSYITPNHDFSSTKLDFSG